MQSQIYPEHYKGDGIEAIDVIDAFALNFNKGNAIKYLLRAGKKGTKQDEVNDLKKAIWYISREIAKNLSSNQET